MELHKQLKNTQKNSAGSNIAPSVDNESKMESDKLLTIFPLEIWLQILQRIFDPKDLHHLHQSCPFFKTLFQDIKTKALFPDVIKIFTAKLNSAPKNTLDILLKCRSVSRTWQLGVDSVLQNFFEYGKLLEKPEQRNESVLNLVSRDIHPLTFDLTAAKFLQHFDEKYAVSKRNPFLCKSVRVHYLFCPRGNLQLTQQALKIFSIYGHHISHFCLTYNFPFPTMQSRPHSVVWFFEQLPQFLNRMPNLKVLELRCHVNSHLYTVNLEDLELSMKSCAFPVLNKLRHLSLENVPTPVFDTVLRNYSHVRMLSLVNSSETSSQLSLYAQPMPNLKQLELALDEISTFMLQETSIVKWQLTTLLLKINVFAVFDWEKLFRILETRWAATLTELKMEADYFWKYPPYTLPSLNLPDLKVFMLCSKQVVPIDFI